MPNWDLSILADARALQSTTRNMLTYLAANLDSTGGSLQRAMHDALASFIGFDPVRHAGVVVLANVGNANVDDPAFHVIDETFPLQPPPQRHVEVAVDSLVLARYVGESELAPAFHITVTRKGAHLFLQATAQPRFPVFAESDSTFFLKVVPS